MKKFICLLLTLAMTFCLMATLTGCDWKDYKDAEEVYAAGDFETAFAMYTALGEYKDCQEKANLCKYEMANALLLEGKYLEAREVYRELGAFQNSKEHIETCNLKFTEETVEAYGAADAINFGEMVAFVAEFGSYFTQEQTELLEDTLAKFRVEEQITEQVKEQMEDPDSFQMVSLDGMRMEKLEDGSYNVLFNITIQEKNEEGEMVERAVSGFVEFTVDLTDCTAARVSGVVL